jgi:branched-chain amino acid transport system permease protein
VFETSYLLTILMFAAIFATLSISFGMAAGQVGMLSISHAAFFGLGAYTYAIVGSRSGDGGTFLLAAGLGVLVAATFGILLGILVLALPHAYVVMVTFSVQIAFTGLCFILVGVTGGAQGIVGIPAPKIFGWEVISPSSAFALSLMLLVSTLLIVLAANRYPVALIARAVRENPVAAESLGIRPRPVSLAYFAVSAGLAGLAGSVYSGVSLFIDPTSFNVHVTILILAMAAVGGLKNPWGAMIGGATISLLPEALSNLPVDSTTIPTLEQFGYGLLLIVMMILRPDGLIGERRVIALEGEK